MPKGHIIKVPKLMRGRSLVAAPGLLSALLLALVLAQWAWLRLDARPLAWDESIHYMGAMGYYRLLLQGGWDLFSRILFHSDFYPPLTELTTGLVFLVTKASPDIAAFLNVFYLAGTIVFLWLAGRRLALETSSLLAGYLVAAAALVSIQSKVFMLDIPLMFWVTLGFYVCLASDQFTRRRWVALYGLVLGLALLTKWSALFFLVPPPLWLAISASFRKDKPLTRWLHVLLAFGLAAVIAGPWYLVHLAKLLKNTSGYFHARGVLENDPSLLSPAAWFYYAGSLFRQFSWPLGLLVAGGLGLTLLRRWRLSLWGMWLVAPYLILMLIRNKDHRYTLPILPIICLASLVWVQDLKAPLRQRLVLGLVVAALLQMGYVHLGEQAGGLHRLLNHKILGAPLIESRAPDTREWPLGAILADVAELGKPLGRKPQLRIIADDSAFTRVTFVVEQTRRPPDVQLSGATNWPAFTDFAVTKTGSLGLDFAVAKPREITQQLLDEKSPVGKRFELLRRYPLPDNSEALLFARRERPLPIPAILIREAFRLGLKQLLSGYIRGAESLSVEIETGSDRETQLGHISTIRVRATNGLVGDFQHKPLGVSFEILDLQISDLLLDLTTLWQGEVIPYYIGGLQVNQLELSDQKVNRSLAQAKDDVQHLRLEFGFEFLCARWLGQVPAEVCARLEVYPDPHATGSDNLRFRILQLRVAWVRLPGWVVQPLLTDFNPLFKLAGFPGQVKLGTLRLLPGRLELGVQGKEHDSPGQ